MASSGISCHLISPDIAHIASAQIAKKHFIFIITFQLVIL